MSLRSSLVLAALSAAPSAAFAADEAIPTIEIVGERAPKPEMAPRLPPFSLDTQVFDFPSGLRVMFQPDSSHPVVSVYMIVNHGSAEDPPGKDEVAHFVEHTWFRSVHGELPPIMDVVNDISGVFNASTWNDWTNYSTVANSEYLPILMRLESLRLTEFYRGMTEELTKTEREVIRNEWRRRNENNSALLFDYLYNVLYPADHPYHSTSTHDTIDNIELKDLQAYVDKNYKPSDTTIMVVGDFDPREAASLIFTNFDKKVLDPRLTDDMYYQVAKPWLGRPADNNNPSDFLTFAYDPDQYAKGNKVAYKFPDPSKRKPRIPWEPDTRPVPPLGTKEIVTEKAPIEKPVAAIGWSLPGGYRSNHLDLQLLGNLSSGIIMGGLREVYGGGDINYNESGCFAQPEVLNTTIMCIAEVKNKKIRPEDVIEKMIDQVYKISSPDPESQPFLDNEFTRARYEFLAQGLLSMDTYATIFAGRADNIGTWAHLTGDPNYYKKSFEQAMSIDMGSIRKLASEYLRRDRVARLIVEPLPDEEVDKTSSQSGYIGASAGDDVVRSSDDMSKVTDAEIAAARVRLDMSKMVDFTLGNGMRVVVLPHGNVPLVQVGLLLGGGPANFDEGLFEFATSNVIGAANDPLRVAGQANWATFAGIPGLVPGESRPTLSFSRWDNAWRMDFAGPSGNLDSALWIIRDEIEKMAPYLDGAGQWKADLEGDLKGAWGRKSWHMSQTVAHHLYPDAKYRHDWTWDEVQVAKAFDKTTVTSFLDEVVDPSNAVLIITGNVDPEKARGLAQGHFGDWQGRTAEKPGWHGQLPEPTMPTQPFRILVEDDAKKTQSQTDMTCRLDVDGERDRPAVGVLSSLLFNQVFTTLRVKEALSYTPVAFAGMRDDGTATLTFSSLALNKGIGRTIQFFLEAAKAVESGKVDQAELTLHKLRLARESGLQAQALDQVLAELTGPLRRGEGWDRITGAGEDIAAVNANALIRIMKGCTEHAIVTITGPKDVIGPQLEALGLTWEVLDAEKEQLTLLEKYDPKAYKAKLKAKAKEDAKKAKEEAKKKEEDEAAAADGEAAPTEPAPATPAPTTSHD